MKVLTAFPVKKTLRSRLDQIDFKKLEFGKYVSDHMFMCDYVDGEWTSPQILPYANLSLSPATLALHYGQTVFEGMKAFKMQDGRINIFRLSKHYDRLVKSLERMCMAVIPKHIFEEALMQLVSLDRSWVPGEPGTALYIRPFMFASEARFGVKISDEYRFIVFTGPTPSLFNSPISVKIESYFSRAGKGGTGFAKCGGNYGSAFLPTREARMEGYDQVLWTDATEHLFIEESGMMNVMFVLDDKLVTPSLSDSILDGVTRDSLLTLANDLGFGIEERPVSILELKQAFKDKTLSAAFGAGTAAVVSPISIIGIDGVDYELPPCDDDHIMYQLKAKLENIRFGAEADIHGWNTILVD